MTTNPLDVGQLKIWIHPDCLPLSGPGAATPAYRAAWLSRYTSQHPAISEQEWAVRYSPKWLATGKH